MNDQNDSIFVHDKFKPLFENRKGIRYYVITGGRLSSKSYTVSTGISHLTTNLNHRVLYTRYVLDTAKDTIIPEFVEKLELLNYDKYYDIQKDRIISNFNDAKIVFKGLKTSSGNQTAKLKSLKDFSCFVLDEAEELNSETDFDKISLSIRAVDVPNTIILILNPTTKEHWIYKRFFEQKGIEAGFNGIKDNVCYIHTTYKDCIQFIPEDYIHEIELLQQSNPEKFNHIILGGWLDKADGVIFTNWEYGDFDESLPFGYGLDFGFFPDPDVLVKCAIDKKRKLLYVKEELREFNQSPDTLKHKIKQIVKHKSVIADCAEKRLISDISNENVKISAVKKGAGSVEEGIKIMKNYKIIVHPDSTKIGSELNNYCEKNGQPVDAFNHAIDAIRYYTTTYTKSGSVFL